MTLITNIVDLCGIDLGSYFCDVCSNQIVYGNKTFSNLLYVNGMVGIGTITPSCKLDIQGGDASHNFLGLNIQSNANTLNGAGQQMLFSMKHDGITYNQGSIFTLRENTAGSNSSSLCFASSGDGNLVECMRMNSSGNVIIGSLADSIDTITGSIVTAGGVGIGASLRVGGAISGSSLSALPLEYAHRAA